MAPAAKNNAASWPRRKEAISEICEHDSISAQQVIVVMGEVIGVSGEVDVLLS